MERVFVPSQGWYKWNDSYRRYLPDPDNGRCALIRFQTRDIDFSKVPPCNFAAK